MKQQICAVFDIDDTLYLERDYVRSGFDAVGRWAAQWIQIQDFGECCWNKFNAGKRKSIFDEVLCDSGRKAHSKIISTLVDIYRTHVPSIALAPDASEALDAISRIASIAVISDGPATSQSRKVEALGLRSFAAPIILTELMGSGFCKPDPRTFELVSQCHPTSTYVYIADNPLKDFAAPKQLGWTTVRVRRQGGLHYAIEHSGITPDREMDDCSGLADLLGHL